MQKTIFVIEPPKGDDYWPEDETFYYKSLKDVAEAADCYDPAGAVMVHSYTLTASGKLSTDVKVEWKREKK